MAARTLAFIVPMLLLADLAAAAPRVHVRGQARLEAQAARDAGDLVLSGGLTDDAGQPLVNEALAVTFSREGDGAAVVFSDEGNVARGCGGGFRDAATARPASAGGPLIVETDEAGRFCLRATVAPNRYVATFAWSGTGLIEGAKLNLPVDTGRQAIALRFEPTPAVLSLDKSATLIEVVASHEENGTTHAGTGLPIYLTNERGDPLGSATTNAAGIVRVTVPSERLGPAGRGTLQASFVGNDEFTRSTHVAVVERHAKVSVDVIDLGAQKPMVPEDGIVLNVAAKTKLGERPTGSVEAIVDGLIVGAAPLMNGEAKVVATFASSQADATKSEVEVHLRYMPIAPWFEPGEETVAKVPVKGPSAWRQVPLVLAAIAVVLWLLAGRLKRSAVASKGRTPPPKPAPFGEARIEIVRATRDMRAGWSGTVGDAHDGSPVAGARVRIERPGFERAEVVAGVHANEMGRFELRAASVTEFDELVVEGPLHAELRQPLPPCGELDIALVSRKRRLINRLVAWAKKRGRPFDAQPEPTPAHVRRAAGGDFGTARWADAVEKAAYGGGEVDAHTEAEVDRLAPDPKTAASLTVRDVPPGENP